ncbi:Uncharacterised protein [Bordetella pertussis]|nr:Uncharacterised protein [Bordetella pertussis]CFU59638.1 Uncharacterised protein [Bordetella pertussis]
MAFEAMGGFHRAQQLHVAAHLHGRVHAQPRHVGVVGARIPARREAAAMLGIAAHAGTDVAVVQVRGQRGALPGQRVAPVQPQARGRGAQRRLAAAAVVHARVQVAAPHVEVTVRIQRAGGQPQRRAAQVPQQFGHDIGLLGRALAVVLQILAHVAAAHGQAQLHLFVEAIRQARLAHRGDAVLAAVLGTAPIAGGPHADLAGGHQAAQGRAVRAVQQHVGGAGQAGRQRGGPAQAGSELAQRDQAASAGLAAGLAARLAARLGSGLAAARGNGIGHLVGGRAGHEGVAVLHHAHDDGAVGIDGERAPGLAVSNRIAVAAQPLLDGEHAASLGPAEGALLGN